MDIHKSHIVYMDIRIKYTLFTWVYINVILFTWISVKSHIVHRDIHNKPYFFMDTYVDSLIWAIFVLLFQALEFVFGLLRSCEGWEQRPDFLESARKVRWVLWPAWLAFGTLGRLFRLRNSRGDPATVYWPKEGLNADKPNLTRLCKLLLSWCRAARSPFFCYLLSKGAVSIATCTGPPARKRTLVRLPHYMSLNIRHFES